MGMSCPGRIRISHRRRISSSASIGEMISVDGVTIADGAGGMGAVGIFEVELVGDDDRDATLLLHLASIVSCGVDDRCLSGILVSDSESSEHRKGETIDATGEATAAAHTSGVIGPSTGIEPIRMTRGIEDPTLSSDESEDIEMTGAAITCTSKSLYKSPLYETISLDLPELTPVIDESTLLVTLPLPCTDVFGDAIVDIDLLLGEHLDTISTEDREIDFNPSRDIEELERLLADNPVPIPRVFDEPLGNSDSMSRSSETSDLFKELIAEFGLNDSIRTEIDDRYHDSEGDILYFEQLLNEDTPSNVSPALLPTEPSSLDLPLPNPKQICLREVERFDPFFSLRGGKTRVMETLFFGFYHMPSPRPAAYSPKEVMYHYYHLYLTTGDGFDPESKKIPSGESKVHIEVLSVLCGNRLPIPDGSLPLSR
ncbi:hypothetical protein Tco_0304041 [Tanacetum coccineum]